MLLTSKWMKFLETQLERVVTKNFSKVEEVVSTDRWILDGNYTRTIPIKWNRVQVVYLDLPFHVVLYRIIKKLVERYQKEELWHGNRETIWKHLFTSDSMILWTIRNFQKQKIRTFCKRGILAYQVC